MNPQWPEIVSQLGPGQNACDIPDIICRVFHTRLTIAINALKHKFGGIVYLIKVIKFQKRGLPHCHMVVKV
jgi:hypothetical protein